MAVDVQRVCRLCLKGNEVMIPIFSGLLHPTPLSHRIMACAQVKVMEGDCLPPNVCMSCLSQVDRSYQFKLLCERSDTTLRANFKMYGGSEEEDCSDGGELWDMTKFTPEVIIKEETEDNILGAPPGGGTNGDTDHSGYLSPPPPAPSVAAEPPPPPLKLVEARLSAPPDHASSPHPQLNGLLFHQSALQPPPLAPLVLHVPPGPSRSRRCRAGDKLFKCRQCNKSYSFSSALSRHKAVHNTALRPHVCQICKKGFADTEKLSRHEKTHAMDVLMTCDLCQRAFTTFGDFQSHKMRGECGGGAASSDSPPSSAPLALLVPARSPNKGRPEFQCPVCLKNFATRGSLDVHSTIHTGVRPFVCSVCQKSFRHKVNLMEHYQRKHSQVRPYYCDVCAARFVTKQELVRHYRKHIGD